MKKFLNFFVLMAVVSLTATSCYQEEIDNLQKQIDALKSGEIATIETQISSINTSITELKSVDNTLREYITALQSDSKKYAQQIADLTAMDKTLEGKIADLQKYVNSGIKDTKDWASATFATLDQMDSLCAVVATIPPQIKDVQTQLDSVKKEVTGDYTKAIETAMTKLEASMKKWVSEQLADYYTIAQIDATLDSLGKKQSDIDSAMVEKIQEQKVALDTAKSQITAAYKKAIKVAIDSLGGKFDTQIATQIATAKNALQTQITAINTEITNIKSRLSTVEANIETLVNRIQSIVVIPQYSDGSVSCTGGVDTLRFDIRPTAVADSVAKFWRNASEAERKNIVSFKIKEVATKTSADPVAEVDTVFFTDNEFKVGVKFQNLPTNAMTSLHIASGATDVASQFFGLTQTEDCFYFEAVNAGAKVALVIPDKKDANPPTAPSLLYSTDGGTNWTDYNIRDTIPAGGLTAGQRIYFKAKTTNTTFGAAGYYDYYYFATTDLVKVGGNIMYLLNGSNPDAATLSPYCFKGLFSPSDGPEGFRQSFIVSASDLKLPAAELSNSCYYRMFASCNMLKTAPATLPATTLKNSCYYAMFNSCYALEAAPALPATKLDTMCYCGMFQSCTTLVSAPVLPAKEMARSCYSQMFDRCYKLVTAPALSATTLAAKCYFKMFCDCIALENPPALDATTLADSCYCNMFTSCSTMVAAPPLPATQLKKECYSNMFSKCVKLSSVTMLATDVSANNCLTSWLAEGAGEDASVTSRTLTINSSLNPNATDGTVGTIKANSAGWDITNGTTKAFAYEKVGWGIPITTGTAPSQTTTVWAPVNCGYDATNYKYGKLYQFGRAKGCGYDDGTSTETITQTYSTNPARTDDPADNLFYKGEESSDFDWYSGTPALEAWPMKSTDTGYKAGKIDNPCPLGWRVPTYDEMNALTGNSGTASIGTDGWDSTKMGYWFNGTASPNVNEGLFLPAAGVRMCQSNQFQGRGTNGDYWSSSVKDGGKWILAFWSGYAKMINPCRGDGHSVRCVKDSGQPQ